MITPRMRFLAARDRVPSPRACFSRYQHHYIWHVCLYTQHFPHDSKQWIEVTW